MQLQQTTVEKDTLGLSGRSNMYYYMMNETEAKNVLILLNKELATLENQDDYMSKHDFDVLSKLKKNLLSTFKNI